MQDDASTARVSPRKVVRDELIAAAGVAVGAAAVEHVEVLWVIFPTVDEVVGATGFGVLATGASTGEAPKGWSSLEAGPRSVPW